MKKLFNSLTATVNSFVNMKWNALLFLVVVSLPVIILAFALQENDNLWWGIAFAATIGWVLYNIGCTLRKSLPNSEKLLLASMIPSAITILIVGLWSSTMAPKSSLFYFAFANLFATITLAALVTIPKKSDKFDKATIVCGAFCMSAISLGSAYAGVNILIDTPEWLKLTTTVIETIGCLCFIGLLGLMGLKFAKVSSEIRNPGKIYFKILSAMMLILFAFMASNFIVNLFGGTVPSLLNSIMGWSLYATFGVLVLVGVVHLCAYAIDKITRC